MWELTFCKTIFKTLCLRQKRFLREQVILLDPASTRPCSGDSLDEYATLRVSLPALSDHGKGGRSISGKSIYFRQTLFRRCVAPYRIAYRSTDPCDSPDEHATLRDSLLARIARGQTNRLTSGVTSPLQRDVVRIVRFSFLKRGGDPGRQTFFCPLAIRARPSSLRPALS